LPTSTARARSPRIMSVRRFSIDLSIAPRLESKTQRAARMIEPPAGASVRFQELVRFVPTDELVKIIRRVLDHDRTRSDRVRSEELLGPGL
jgi:hypothetical protein